MQTLDLNDADADVLISLLVEELRAQEGLETAIADLEDSVLRQDLDGLECRLEGLSPRLGELEETMKRRERVLGRFASRLGVPAGPGVMTAVLTSLPASRRGELGDLHGRVRGSGKRVREANRRLRVIVSDLARLNQSMVRAAFGIEGGGTTYDHRGAAGAAGTLSIMDRRF